MKKSVCKSLLFSITFLLLMSIISCKTTKNQLMQNTEISKANNFSHNTIIVYVKNGTSEEEIQTLCKKYNLQVLYIYKNFSSCALSSQEPLTDKELEELITKVESESFVLSVQKDYIMSLDSNDF